MEENCRIVVEDSRKYYQELEADLKLLTLELKDMKREKENFDSSIFKLSTKDILWQVSRLYQVKSQNCEGKKRSSNKMTLRHLIVLDL